MIRRDNFWIHAGVVAMVVGFVFLNSSCMRDLKAPTAVLDPGWQFYSKPTTLEPPGTVFRIDENGRRFLVDEWSLPKEKGEEVVGRTERTGQTTVNALAKLLLKGQPVQAGDQGGRVTKFQFEMRGTEREVTKDKDIQAVLPEFVKKIHLQKGNRYFLIREARSATEMDYVLTDEFVNNLGGEAFLNGYAKLEGNIYVRRGNNYVLSQKFPTRMRVMFLPEEIVQAESGLGGLLPKFTTIPVTEVLNWSD